MRDQSILRQPGNAHGGSRPGPAKDLRRTEILPHAGQRSKVLPGVDRTKTIAIPMGLKENSSVLEEMKADLASLFVVEAYASRATLRRSSRVFMLAARVLQNNKPRRISRPNHAACNGILSRMDCYAHLASKTLHIHYTSIMTWSARAGKTLNA